MREIKKLLKRVLLISMLSGVSACATVQSPVPGYIYTDVKGSLYVTSREDYSKQKVGKSTAKSILGLFSSGDASVETAAKNGGITKIHHVDYESRSVLGVIAEFTVVVYGD